MQASAGCCRVAMMSDGQEKLVLCCGVPANTGGQGRGDPPVCHTTILNGLHSLDNTELLLGRSREVK